MELFLFGNCRARILTTIISTETAVHITVQGGFKSDVDKSIDDLKMQYMQQIMSMKTLQAAASEWMKRIASILSLLMFGATIGSAARFYRRWMKNDEFQNTFITAPFLRLEEIEIPLLPLDEYEVERISILSEAMVAPGDQVSTSTLILVLLRTVPFLVLIISEWVTFVLCKIMESLFALVIEIERSTQTQIKIGGPGSGMKNPFTMIFTLFVYLQDGFRYLSFDIRIDKCAPQAVYPNVFIDLTVIVLVMTYFVFSLFGPIFSTLRHIIMVDQMPNRAVERALWLRRQLEDDRALMPEERLLEAEPQFYEEIDVYVFYQTYIKEPIDSVIETVQGLLNMPTINCISCGVQGNLQKDNFSHFFTACDSCDSYICFKCMHVIDEHEEVNLRTNCPNCAGEIDAIEIDGEPLPDPDPLDRLLDDFLSLRPSYKVSVEGIEQHLEEIKAFEEANAEAEEENLFKIMGIDHLKVPNN